METMSIQRDGPVAIVSLTRQQAGNALSRSLVTELTVAFAHLAEAGYRAVVITGKGKHFCSGADLDELAGSVTTSEAGCLAEAAALANLFSAILRCPLPTIAAVHGAAYGGGAGLAAACDFVIAAPDARFQFSETKLGFIPAVVAVFLPRRVPPPQLVQLFIAPTPLPPEQAKAFGLVDEVAADPLARAGALALDICRKSAPAAIAMTKKLLLEATLPHLDDRLADAARANAAYRAHPEFRLGIGHFIAAHTFLDWLSGD
jgi:methylglutaconyl-CoA hydratase